MPEKERPDYFSCGCGKHFVFDVTSSMRSKARTRKRNSSETDTTDSRSSSRSHGDSVVGKLAEVVLEEFLSEQGVSTSVNDGWRYDMKVNGKTAEVKARDYTQTSSRYCDLLVRDRKDTNWSPSDVDIVVQVMVNGTNTKKAYITGYVSGRHAANCGLFRKAKTHRTRKVPHTDLKRIENLL